MRRPTTLFLSLILVVSLCGGAIADPVEGGAPTHGNASKPDAGTSDPENEKKDPPTEPDPQAGDPEQAAEAEESGDATSERDPERPESKITEKVVVSASATTRALLDAPAAVDLIEGEELEAQPADQLVDHLRRVPGVNVVQFSSRDVNIASRSATGGINNSTLVLTDGRSLYQDFLGFVMWEFAPNDFSQVESVEVVRGPASSLWGANAVGGMVHVITKSPRDTLGGRLRVGVGNYDSQRVDFNQSFLAGPWALRVSGGFYQQDAFDRPETITNFFGVEIDPDLGLIEDGFRDSGTRQPRFDVRADWDAPGGGRWILQGGSGLTRGWITTGLGPFDIDDGTSLTFLQARFQKGPYEASFSTNFFDGDATNLINAIPFGFTNGATKAAIRSLNVFGERTLLGWGAEVERSDYDLSIAPDGDERSRAAIFGELDRKLGERFWLVAAGRWDYYKETIGSVFSPRIALRYKPRENHTLRTAWGKAFRSPSIVETNLLVPKIPVAILEWEQIDKDNSDIFGGFPLFSLLAEVVCEQTTDNCGAPAGEIPDYIAVTAAEGFEDLEEEVTASFEIGWAARIGDFDLSATVYRTHSRGGIDFPWTASYGYGPDGVAGTTDDILLPSDPNDDGIDEAPPVDVCPYVSALTDPPFDQLCTSGPLGYNAALSYLLDGLVPSLFRYANGSRARNKGFELGSTWHAPGGLQLSLNYSWQDVPESDGVAMDTRIDTVLAETESGTDLDGDGRVADTSAFINIPAEHRVALSAQLVRPRWSAAVTLDRVEATFWQDVLTEDFWGYVDAYTLVGLRGLYRFRGDRLELVGQVTNLLDDAIQQHIYGDIIERRATVSLGWSWDRN